ncbi:LD-carboxypeptidase [Phenylobacterium sp.]|uniref:S66 peptidase family protein n=1 Tax=Phenylobacterium sp. TaxID=1871053 RepID=UPI0035AE4989
MDRRAFLAATGAAALAGSAAAQPRGPLLRPAMLRPGDRVALVNPSTALHDPAAETRARAVVEALELTPVVYPGFLNRPRDYAASVRLRLDELHRAFSDPTIKGVFSGRGGYGVSEIVDRVDYGLIRRNPKVLVGFSDTTLLQLAIQKRSGLSTFHGRMAALTGFSDYSLQALRRAVMSPEPLGVLPTPAEANPLRPTYPLQTITPGTATGPLVGGNLSMIAAAMGTPWEIDTRGAIFFFEDVEEAPYSIARMLLNLRHAGKLQAAAGILVGACARCEGPLDASPYTLNEVFDHLLGDLKIPVFAGLPIGHTTDQLTLPIGASARLDATGRTLTVLEPGVTA